MRPEDWKKLEKWERDNRRIKIIAYSLAIFGILSALGQIGYTIYIHAR